MADNDTLNLFDEDVSQPRTKPESTALVIRAQAGRTLSREQRSFNRLTKRIADLERSIVGERQKLDLLLGRYHEKVAPLVQNLARRQLDLAQALARAVGRLAPRKRQREYLRAMILNLCDEAFCVAKPDAEAEALYDAWAEKSYRAEVQQRAEDLKNNLAEELRARYGIDADVSDDDDSAEGLARLLRRLEEQVRSAAATEPPSQPPRRVSAKRKAREEQRQQRETLTKKSVRSIYLSLAKVLHPDTVPDAAERSLREDFMKQATHAYRQGDIAALLKLELRWVARGDAGMHALTDEALSVYLPALREQVTQLEDALHSQYLDPHYFQIGPVAGLAEKTALYHLGEWARDLRVDIAALDHDLEFVKHCASNTALGAFAREYVDAREADRDLEDAIEAALGRDDRG